MDFFHPVAIFHVTGWKKSMQAHWLFYNKTVGLTAGLNFRRWPLFVPLLSAITGLALTRTEMLGIATAAIVLAVFTITLFVFKQR